MYHVSYTNTKEKQDTLLKSFSDKDQAMEFARREIQQYVPVGGRTMDHNVGYDGEFEFHISVFDIEGNLLPHWVSVVNKVLVSECTVGYKIVGENE